MNASVVVHDGVLEGEDDRMSVASDRQGLNFRSKGVVQDMCADELLVCLGEALERKHGHAF
jgi:hypothetical protein